jgi:disulfide oxidoreductase YuzD
VTGKLIKINSRIYKQLVKDKILNLDNKSRKDNIVYNSLDIDKTKLKQNPNFNLVKNNGKIKEYRRKVTEDERHVNLIMNASKVVKKHLNEFSDSMTDDEIFKKVKVLLSQELIGEPPPKKEKIKIIEEKPIDSFDIEESDENSESDASDSP